MTAITATSIATGTASKVTYYDSRYDRRHDDRGWDGHRWHDHDDD